MILDVNNHTGIWYYFDGAVEMLPLNIGMGVFGLYGIPFIIIQAICFYKIIWEEKNLLHCWFATVYCQATLTYLYTSIPKGRGLLSDHTTDFTIAVLVLCGIHAFFAWVMAWRNKVFPKTGAPMKRMVAKIIKLAFSLFYVMVIIWVYFGVCLPIKTIVDPSYWDIDFQSDRVAREKVRGACHKLLFNFAWLGGHHDAFIALVKVGNKDSIPYLIRSLKGLEKKYPNEKNSGFVICTYGHCEEALEQLTGMEVDWDSETWMNWWKQTGRYLPFNEETRQLGLPIEKNVNPKTQE